MLLEEQPNRHLPLEGSYNLRDVGGYPTRDGGLIRWRTLLRADSLHALTPGAQAALLDYGLRTIVDLRRPAELRQQPNVFAASERVAYRHMPIFDDQSRLVTAAVLQPDLVTVYRLTLDNCQPQVRTVLEVAAQPETPPLLIHCTAGKDRTGLLIALLLGIAGVNDDMIAADYALTTRYLQPLLEQLRAQRQQEGVDMAVYERLLLSEPEHMAETLAYLNKQYGGVMGYAAAIGLSTDQCERIRHNLVEGL
ncbi:MAG: tyrosine-protein phosphatase [Chloroflexaceae bacterium]|jgi:protein-tyrosine phosphatase|nr:tyrosine-protein phosphatase [Chloroflexaceae bacterium]